MEMFITCIYKILWHLLHYLVSLYTFCLWLRLRIIAFALRSYDLCRTQAAREQSEYDFLQQCKKHLNKIPSHLNLLIGPGNDDVNDELLIRIFSYALHMNINCISYYDTRYTNTSSTKTSLTALEKLKCPKGWKSKTLDAHHSIWYFCKDQKLNGRKYINGFTNNDTSNLSTSLNDKLGKSLSSHKTENSSLEVYEITPQNNRALIAEVCRDLFKKRYTPEIQNLLKQRTSLTERINQELTLRLEKFTEPQLSIIFDDNMCTFGMMPWHTRFTEFYRHAKGQAFDAKTFAHILYKYSHCEQRWGK